MKNRFLTVFIIALATILGGCSHFKSKNHQSMDTQTTSFEDPSGFGEYGFSKADRLKAAYNQSYYFAFDCYEVVQDDLDSLKVQADYMTMHPQARLRLEGNADERGSREYNVALGWKRAKAVASILRRHGVSDSQIALVSYGKEKPLALGHDEESYGQNRRVDLIYEIK